MATRTRPLSEPQTRVMRVLGEQPAGTAWESTIRFLIHHHYGGTMPTPANVRQTLAALQTRGLVEQVKPRVWRVRPGASA